MECSCRPHRHGDGRKALGPLAVAEADILTPFGYGRLSNRDWEAGSAGLL